MRRIFLDGTALASLLAGAVLAVFPALIILIVTLFYDSAGGVLILLGSLVSALPHPAPPMQGGGALPMFQVLETGTTGVLIRSLAGTMACALALGLLIGFRRIPDRRPVLAALLCCAIASAVSERDVALVLIPAGIALAVRLLPEGRPA